MVKGGMYGKGWGHEWRGGLHGGGVWQGVHGKGAYMAEVHGKGACMQERRPLKRAVRILLECILVLILKLSVVV